MKTKPERLARQEFQCPCCQSWFVVSAHKIAAPAQVIEANRDKLKELHEMPIPRIDVKDAGEIVAGCDDQRKITRCEQTSIDELFRKDKPFRESARRMWK